MSMSLCNYKSTINTVVPNFENPPNPFSKKPGDNELPSNQVEYYDRNGTENSTENLMPWSSSNDIDTDPSRTNSRDTNLNQQNQQSQSNITKETTVSAKRNAT